MRKNKVVYGWQSNNAIFFLLVGVVLSVVYKLGDGYVIGILIQSTDLLLKTLVYLTLGALTGLFVNFVLCQTSLGKIVDPGFSSIKGVSIRAHIYAAFSGILAAIATGIYLWSLGSLDPSIVVPLTSLAIIYMAVADALRGRIGFKKILPSIFFVVSGVAIASVKPDFNFSLTGTVLIIVFFGYNLVNALSELIGKEAVDESDAISYGFWRFFWLTLSAVMIAVLTSLFMGKAHDYLQLLVESVSIIPFVMGIMILVFFANGWANRGMKLSNATLKNLVMTSQVVFAVFATAIVAHIWPGIFPTAEVSVTQWLLRLFGAILVMWSIFLLGKRQREMVVEEI